MDRGKAGIFLLLCMGAALVGCGGKEAAMLDESQRQLDVALVERQAIAQHLNDYREGAQRLEQQLAEEKARLHRPDSAELARLLADQGLKALDTKDDGGVLRARLGGNGGAAKLVAALRALAPSERALALATVRVQAKGEWSVELEVPAEPGPAVVAPAAPEPPPQIPMAPMGGPFSWGNEHKWERLRLTQARIRELDKVLEEANRLSRQKNELAVQLRALQEVKPVDRLVGQRPVVEALFGGPRPMFPVGTAQFHDGRVKLGDLGPGDTAKRILALAPLGKVEQAGEDAIVVELKPAG